MGWIGIGLSDIGCVRRINQDAFAIDNAHGLWVVADGMGGHAGGEIASRLAVETVVSYFKDHYAKFANARSNGEREALLVAAVEAANQEVRAYGRAHPEVFGMGTTIVVLQILDEPKSLATLVHAGDSRAYRIRDRQLIALTRDHSLVEEQIALGLLRPDDAERHPLRHILTKAVGIEPRVDPVAQSLVVSPADRFLLCTDGLTKMLSDADIAALLETTLHESDATAAEVCRALVREANARGGEDNITVVLVERRNSSDADQDEGVRAPRRNNAGSPK